MRYRTWFKNHGKKHQAIMRRLTHLSDEEVIAYFRFENMRQAEPDFCPLYAKNTPCHPMENLNCYLCACPNFRFDDRGMREVEGKRLYSICGIDSKDGAQYIGDEVIHQNCSGCLIPHHEHYIRTHFDRDWFAIMHKVEPADLGD